jgi:hypothetical protein
MVTVIEVAAFDYSVSGFPIGVGNDKKNSGNDEEQTGMSL